MVVDGDFEGGEVERGRAECYCVAIDKSFSSSKHSCVEPKVWTWVSLKPEMIALNPSYLRGS